jgi:hydroxypyruvate isomerase
MPRFAANLTLMFNEVPFIERFARAARAGFTGVEFLFPYAWPAQQIAELLHENTLTPVLHNLPPGDWDAGDRGIACHPQRMNEFQDGVGTALEYARAIGCGQLNCLAGLVPEGVSGAQARDTLVANLRHAAAQAATAGIRLLSEPINTRDMPGFFLNRTQQALDLFDDAGGDNLWLQYDVYHMQIMEGDLAPTLARVLPRIAHIQFADTPGRHEPGTGEINFPFLFEHLDRIGYRGWMSAEYRPLGETEAGLAWLRAGAAAGAASP